MDPATLASLLAPPSRPLAWCRKLLLARRHKNTCSTVRAQTAGLARLECNRCPAGRPGLSMSSGSQLTAALREQAFGELDAQHIYCDAVMGQLARETENGRLLRLLVRLSMVTERADMDPQWAETGEPCPRSAGSSATLQGMLVQTHHDSWQTCSTATGLKWP